LEQNIILLEADSRPAKSCISEDSVEQSIACPCGCANTGVIVIKQKAIKYRIAVPPTTYLKFDSIRVNGFCKESWKFFEQINRMQKKRNVVAERPIECSHCKKPVCVIYKEIVEDTILSTEMCADCPVMQERLHGSSPNNKQGEKWAEGGLYCGHCRTSLDNVKMGQPLGCAECYTVFGDVLVNDLIASSSLPEPLKKNLSSKKNQPLHIGKSRDKTTSIPLSDQLSSLNEALNEALKRENYEQAAWLRDQINALKQKAQ
jgi:protein arginine kinase activator